MRWYSFRRSPVVDQARAASPSPVFRFTRTPIEPQALRAQLALAFTTEDIVEGVAAFREKREAVWKMR